MAATYDVILPAGGELDPLFAKVALTSTKALIKVRNGLLIVSCLQALKLSGCAERIIVIGNEDVKKAVGDGVEAVLAPAKGLPENILLGLKKLLTLPNPPDRFLIVTTDLPYLDEKVLIKWLDTVPDADFCGPLVTEEDYMERFPGSSSTFAKLRDGSFTLGGAYVVRTEALRRCMPQIEKAIASRKNVAAMASLLGTGFLFRVMTRRATLAEIEAKVCQVLGARVKAVPDSPPELAFDIDDIADYEYALRNN